MVEEPVAEAIVALLDELVAEPVAEPAAATATQLLQTVGAASIGPPWRPRAQVHDAEAIDARMKKYLRQYTLQS